MTMPGITFALSRGDVASYVSALFTVYIVLIFLRILFSWIRRRPQNGIFRAVAGLVSQEETHCKIRILESGRKATAC